MSSFCSPKSVEKPDFENRVEESPVWLQCRVLGLGGGRVVAGHIILIILLLWPGIDCVMQKFGALADNFQYSFLFFLLANPTSIHSESQCPDSLLLSPQLKKKLKLKKAVTVSEEKFQERSRRRGGFASSQFPCRKVPDSWQA